MKFENYEQAWEEYWKEIVCPNDILDVEQVKKELSDYLMILDDLPELFMHITGGRCSKTNTDKHVVISLHDDHVNELIDEAVAEALQDKEDEQ